MAREPHFGVSGAFRDLRLGWAFLLCAALALGLSGFGRTGAAAGVGLGYGLFLLNLLLLRETARSLLDGASERRVRLIVGLSAGGRLVLLAVGLSAIGVLFSRETLLGACGGLLVAQVNLHVWAGSRKEDVG